MSTAKTDIPEAFQDLSAEERIQYVQDLWDFIAQSPADVPVPQAHKHLLDERLDVLETASDQGRPWSEVREELLQKLGQD